MTLEFHVINVNWLGPKTTKSEIESFSKLGWVWVSVSLTIIQQEVTKIISLSKLKGVCDDHALVEFSGNCSFDQNGLEHNILLITINNKKY